MHCHTCQTAEDVFRIVKDKEISFIQIWFTDILGVLKSFSIRPSELEEAMKEAYFAAFCRIWALEDMKGKAISLTTLMKHLRAVNEYALKQAQAETTLATAN